MATKAKGVKSMKLDKEDAVADMAIVEDESKQVLIICDNGQMKRVKLDQFVVGSRPVKGSRICKWVKSNPSQIERLFTCSLDDTFTIVAEDTITFAAKDIALMNATSTFSTPFGKMETMEMPRELTFLEKGNWPESEDADFKQEALF